MHITQENQDLLCEIVSEMYSKYSDLVYYANNRDNDICDEVARIQEEYPGETRDIRGHIPEEVLEELSHEQLRLLSKYDLNPHFEEGFNSGCAAAFRLVVSALADSDDYESFTEIVSI